MKNFLYIILLGVALSCTQRDYVVSTDENQKANFSQYQLFGFTPHALSSNTQFTLGDLVLKTDIRKSILEELDAKGYERDPENPDLLVDFKIFEEETKITTYADSNNDGYGVYVEDEGVRQADDLMNVTLEPGSLLINFTDSQTGEIVWSGYASGVINGDSQFDSIDKAITSAVERIFEKYNYRNEVN